MFLKFSFYNLFCLIIFTLSGLSFYIFMILLFMDLTYLIEWEIISMNSCSIVMILLFDWMSTLFMSFVLLISSLVIYYSKDYMMFDLNKDRFIILVVLFIFSMMMMIISPNLISILLGWDGLGLVSYCLVIFFQNIKSFNAGMITVLTNRIGDVALLISISWMMNYGSWSFFYYLNFYSIEFSTFLIMSLVMLAAMTKSAQIPFSSWLPAAMAAPTPVSALVHSSTLVTAGVYLMIRFNNLLMLNSFLSKSLLLLGSLTMFMSGLGANFEMDLKKIIALSTLSQLGLMMGVLSLGLYKLAFFHLLTHALFKALLFLCAGVMIHSMNNFQDIRWSGSMVNQMPLTLMCFNISSLSLCGMPFLAGFYSKDLILEMMMMSNMNFMIFFFFFSTGLTVSYSFRLIFISLCMNFNGFSLMNLFDESWLMLKSMFLLSGVSIFSGSLLMWLIFPFFFTIILPLYFKLLVLLICLVGCLFGYLLNSKFYFIYMFFYENFLKLIYFFSLMWFMPFIFSYNINYFFLNKGGIFSNSFNLGWNEMISGNFIFLFLKTLILKFSKLQNNYFNMFFYMLLSFIFILIINLMMS